MKKTVIDIHVHPAFIEPMSGDEKQEAFAREMYGLCKTAVIRRSFCFSRWSVRGLTGLHCFLWI